MLAPLGLNDLLLYRLARLNAVAGAKVVRLCEGQYGITRREWRMVALLAEGGALQPSTLAEQAQLDRARTSRAISGLVAKRLVQRQEVASDRRHAMVSLSPAGRELHAALFPAVADINRELVAGLTPAQAVILDEALNALQQAAEALAARVTLPKAGRHSRRGRYGAAV